jgi:hypothetical protein
MQAVILALSIFIITGSVVLNIGMAISGSFDSSIQPIYHISSILGFIIGLIIYIFLWKNESKLLWLSFLGLWLLMVSFFLLPSLTAGFHKNYKKYLDQQKNNSFLRSNCVVTEKELEDKILYKIIKCPDYDRKLESQYYPNLHTIDDYIRYKGNRYSWFKIDLG